MVSLFAVVVAVSAAPLPASATPVRNTTRWSVILCKFSDQPQEPQNAAYFQNFLTDAGRGSGGMADYLADQSGGRVSLAGSAVRGWYTMSWTLSDFASLSRSDRIGRCVSTAQDAGYTVPSGNRIAVMLNQDIDAGSAGGRVLLTPTSWSMDWAAHEMLHGYGLGHSYSNDLTFQAATWSAPGEYDDPWDHMSALNVYASPTGSYGRGAVGLSAFHRDELGWLPGSQIYTFGADGVGSRSMWLTTLSSPVTFAGSHKLIRVPFNPDDLFNYYTIEYRRRTGWDAGIPSDIVLIHEVRGGTPNLQRAVGGARSPVQSVNANGVQISVSFTMGDRARVSITSDVVDRCLVGWVWREARAGDKVCVTGATRSQVRADNAVAQSRWVNGPYGPHSCVSGYVWREAFIGDDVCVDGSQRTQAASDNAAAASRRNPARFVYGPNTCVSGYMWREADNADYVCVTGATRSQVRADNAAASSRWVNGPYGPHTCKFGYVWREAFIGDDVCVDGSQRTQAANDNAAAASRVLRPGG